MNLRMIMRGIHIPKSRYNRHVRVFKDAGRLPPVPTGQKENARTLVTESPIPLFICC